MTSLPKTEKTGDLSSICNYADTTPIGGDFTMATSPKKEKFVYRDEAIPFITVDADTKQFRLHAEAIHMLESIEGDLGVVTIAGPYRTGKSSLAGRALLGNPNAFQTGSTIQACTKGLWLYARPVIGSTTTTIIIDSEGLNSTDENENHDLRIMTLSVLLSSKLIYNSMNAIDEQSLNQLNLVVNLTKQIQLKASNHEGEFQDPEELAKIFPSFLWLVRDFNLALVNQEGVAITPKEYIELALQEQSGMSEKTESKNRTRRLFKTLFSERDCMTFERPIGDEEQLQRLNELPDEELSANFVRQLESLKKRVLGKMQTKEVNGKTINGPILITMAQQYITAFNQGSMPCIENAWTNICQSENQKALQKAREEFRSVLDDKLTLPCSLFDLECDYKDAKRDALRVYRNRSMAGSNYEEGEYSIRHECKEMLEQIKQRNGEACTLACTGFLNQCHREIMQSLSLATSSTGEDEAAILGDLHAVELALQQLEQTFEQTGPAGEESMRCLIYEKFRSQVAFESGSHFFNLLKGENEVRHALLEDRIQHESQWAEEEKKEMINEVKKYRELIRVKERECYEAQAQSKIAEERMASAETHANETESELKAEWDSQRRKLQTLVQAASRATEIAESEQSRLSRQVLEVNSKAEQEHELLVQEVAYLKTTETELRKREQDLTNELKEVAQAGQGERLEREEFLQKQIKEAIQAKAEIQEKAQDLQEQLEAAQQELLQYQCTSKDKEKQLTQRLGQAQAQLALNTVRGNNGGDQGPSSKLQKSLEAVQNALKDAQTRQKELEESHKTELAKLLLDNDIHLAQKDKDIAVLNQRASQHSERIGQLETHIKTGKSEMTSLLSRLETKKEECSDGLNEQKLLDSLQTTHQTEIQEMREAHEAEKVILTDELSSTQKLLENDSLISKVKIVELQKSLDELGQQIESLESEKGRLERSCKSQKDRNDSLIETMQSKSSESVIELTRQHESEIEELEQTIHEMQEQAKQELARLKITFERDIEQVTHKWQDDRQKTRIEEQQLRKEYEARLNEDEQKNDEERVFLEQQLSQLQFESQAQLDKTQRDLMLLGNEHGNLQTLLAQKIEQLQQLESTSSESIKNQLRTHADETIKLQEKIESLSISMTTKEQTLITTNLQLQTCQADLIRKKMQLESLEETQRSELTRLEDKVAALRDENQSLKDALQGKNMDFSRDVALKDQTISFLEHKLSDQQNVMATRQRELEYQIDSAKSERLQLQAEQSARFLEQKQELESRLESRRKAHKTLQAEYNAKVPELQRQVAILSNQMEESQRVASERTAVLKIQLEKTSSQLSYMQEQQISEQKSAHEKFKVVKLRVQELEKENQNLQSELEKDQALFDDKIKFLTDQKTRLEVERGESERRLKDEQESLQRIRNNEKEKAAKNRQECVTHLETYYKQLTQRIQDEAKKAAEDSQSKLKALQDQTQELNTQLEIVKREKDINGKANFERLDKQDKIETNLRNDLLIFRKQHEEALDKYEARLDQMREAAKVKITKAEKERKDMELSQTSQRHNFSIEEAKWNMKSEQMANDITQLNEETSRLQKKHETLLRENQKLRTSQRAQFQSSMNFSSNRSSNYTNNLGLSTQSFKVGRPDSTSNASVMKQLGIESSTSTLKQNVRNVTILTGSAMPTAGMTRVATFNTTKSSILSRQIHESMARCSPKPKALAQQPNENVQGARSLMKSHNLGNKLGLLTKSVSSKKLTSVVLPFRQRQNTLTTANVGKQSPLLFSKREFAAVMPQKVSREDDENQTPSVRYEEYELRNSTGKTTMMTLDELESMP